MRYGIIAAMLSYFPIVLCVGLVAFLVFAIVHTAGEGNDHSSAWGDEDASGRTTKKPIMTPHRALILALVVVLFCIVTSGILS